MKTDGFLTQEERQAVMDLAASLAGCPELGFREERSSETVRKAWQSIGLEVKGPYAITGLRAEIKGSHPGPSVALLCELDAVANSKGVMHACGHNIQSAQVFAAAIDLLGKRERLAGTVVLIACPAEEFLEIEERRKLQQEGRIGYLAGKQELIRLGVFDDIDMAMMLHAHPDTPEYKLFLGGTNLGFTAKDICFTGKAAHGSEPWNGRNALQAATLFLSGINANRETFKDSDRIRIHPIITKGGDVVNSIPDDVRIETYVRGATAESIRYGCSIVDRCAEAVAMMIDTKATVRTIPGYLPLRQDPLMTDGMAEIARGILPEDAICYGVDSVGSSDVGDLSCLMPVIQPTMGGFIGSLHSPGFHPVDTLTSCLLGGQLLSSLTYSLLADDGARAKKIIKESRALMTRQEYIRYLSGR